MSPFLLLMIPLLGAVACVSASRRPDVARVLALVAAGATAIVAAILLVTFASTLEPVVTPRLPGATGAMVALLLDGISAPLVTLTALLGVTAVLVSWNVERRAGHLALLLTLEAAVIAVFLAADLVLFYVAWEAVLIPMFFLIGGWGHEDRRRAAMKFFVYTFAGSALMLTGIIVLVLATGGQSAMSAGAELPMGTQQLVFWLLAAGLLVKVPVWPLHTWLPDAHVEAPTAGSVMLAGVLLKMGVYGFMRLCIPYAPAAFDLYAPLLGALGAVGIVYGAVMALAQSDLKRLVAYSSVAHMGFVMLALASGTVLGLTGAMLGMVSHGLVAGILFLLVGALHERTGTRDIGAFGGLGHTMPGWSALFVAASLASLGLPGLSGFPGEFAAVVSGFGAFGWPVAIAGVGVVLGGAYSLRAVRLVVHGQARESVCRRDLGVREYVALVPLAALVIALGIWPRLLADVVAPAMEALHTILRAVG